MTSGPAADGARDAPLASPGARWTEEEDEELVAAVRAVADLAVIAEQRGRTRGAIVSRLLRMIPAREDIPEEEQFGWPMVLSEAPRPGPGTVIQPGEGTISAALICATGTDPGSGPNNC